MAVIFAVMAGGQLFGFLGMLLALPVAAVTNVLLRYAHQRYRQSELYVGEKPAIVLDGGRPAPYPARSERQGPRPEVMGVPQLPLALHYPRDQRLETFIGAPDGALALRAIAVGASHDWVYLEGAAGTGKTHQALAMCSSAEQAGRLPTYVPLASAAGRVRAALDGLDARELVALDGLDEVAGNREDEVALFDFHNRARAAG